MAENAIVSAIPHTHSLGFAMIASGDISNAIVGVLMIVSMTSLIVRGLWKVVMKVMGLRLFESFYL